MEHEDYTYYEVKSKSEKSKDLVFDILVIGGISVVSILAVIGIWYLIIL